MIKVHRYDKSCILVPFVGLTLLIAGAWGCGGTLRFDTDGDTDGHTDPVDDTVDDGITPDAPDGMEIPDLPADPTVDSPPDTVDDTSPPCPDGDVQCVDGGAERCEGGVWVDLGPCPLGCDETMNNCYVPTNVPADLVDPTAGDLDLTSMGPAVLIDTDDGSITSEGGDVLRPPVTGHDADSGITFVVHSQGGDAPDIGVFSMGSLTVPPGIMLTAIGDNALAILASDTITLGGMIEASAVGQTPGPGGWAGGDGGEPGLGMCPGASSEGTAYTTHHCSGGGGGGGFGGAGGDGGNGETECDFAGGAGGDACGTALLSPLQGGSGGAGGGLAWEDEGAFAGTGGGGGGAVQLVAVTSIFVADGGGVHTAGDGGGECNTSGGGGGGSGGGVLLESPSITVMSGGIIAANGGGGGAGDCT